MIPTFEGWKKTAWIWGKQVYCVEPQHGKTLTAKTYKELYDKVKPYYSDEHDYSGYEDFWISGKYNFEDGRWSYKDLYQGITSTYYSYSISGLYNKYCEARNIKSDVLDFEDFCCLGYATKQSTICVSVGSLFFEASNYFSCWNQYLGFVSNSSSEDLSIDTLSPSINLPSYPEEEQVPAFTTSRFFIK